MPELTSKPTLAQRLRPGSATVKGTALRRPMRFWMTGSLAVVMAAFVVPRALVATSSNDAQRLLRHSRYGVEETVQRIEAAARSGGLSVLATMGGQQPVIVLASSVGGTLVIMDEASAQMEIPFSVTLQKSADGGVDVSFIGGRGRFGDGIEGLPSAVVADLAALPDLLDRALG